MISQKAIDCDCESRRIVQRHGMSGAPDFSQRSVEQMAIHHRSSHIPREDRRADPARDHGRNSHLFQITIESLKVQSRGFGRSRLLQSSIELFLEKPVAGGSKRAPRKAVQQTRFGQRITRRDRAQVFGNVGDPLGRVFGVSNGLARPGTGFRRPAVHQGNAGRLCSRAGGVPKSDTRAHRMSDQSGLLDLQRFESFVEVGRVAGDVVARRGSGSIRVAMTPEVQRDRPCGLGQSRNDSIPSSAVMGEAVQENDRASLRAPLVSHEPQPLGSCHLDSFRLHAAARYLKLMRAQGKSGV